MPPEAPRTTAHCQTESALLVVRVASPAFTMIYEDCRSYMEREMLGKVVGLTRGMLSLRIGSCISNV